MAVTQRNRITNLKSFIASGGFGPVIVDGHEAEDLPGYTLKKIVDDPRSKHLINIVQVDPGMGKYKHFHDNSETVMFVLEGQGDFLIDESRSVPIKVGDVCHSFPGEIHGTRNTGNVPLRYLVVEGPLPLQMQRDLANSKPIVSDRNRVVHVEEFRTSPGFAPIVVNGEEASDLPGYTAKFIVEMGNPQGKHLINVVNVEPGFKKYNHWHNNAETVLVFLQGEGLFVVDEDNTVLVKAGDVAHSFPGEVHGTRNTGNVPLQYLVVEGPLPLDMNKA